MVELSSFIRNTASPDGCGAKWRGPAPGEAATDGGWCGCRAPVDFVEAIHEELVGAEIGREHERAARHRANRVRVRAGLPRGVRTRSRVLHDRGRRLHPAIGADGKCRDAAAAVVGDERVRARRVHRDVAGAAAAAGLLVDARQPARVVDAEGHQRAGLRRTHRVGLADRVEHRLGRVPGQEARVDGLRDEHGLRQTRIRGIQREAVDAATRAIRVRAEIDRNHG